MMNEPASPPNGEINFDTTPVLYVDQIFLSRSEAGITIDFGQRAGPSNKVRIVSRVGLSPDHARTFLQRLASAAQPPQAADPSQQPSDQIIK